MQLESRAAIAYHLGTERAARDGILVLHGGEGRLLGKWPKLDHSFGFKGSIQKVHQVFLRHRERDLNAVRAPYQSASGHGTRTCVPLLESYEVVTEVLGCSNLLPRPFTHAISLLPCPGKSLIQRFCERRTDGE